MMNEKFSYVVIDNLPSAIIDVTTMADKVPWLELAGTFTDPFKGLDYLQEHPVDLLFLDIEMPSLLGTELLRMLTDPPLTILCTGHKEFALEGYELNVADYLLKPFSFERFYRALEFAQKMLLKPTLPPVDLEKIRDDVIAIPIQHRKYGFIGLQHINYIRSDGDQCIISLDQSCALGEWVNEEKLEKVIRCYMRLGELEERLSSHRFLRIHRQTIVALDRIIELCPGGGSVELSMPAGKRLSITDANKKVLIQWLGSER